MKKFVILLILSIIMTSTAMAFDVQAVPSNIRSAGDVFNRIERITNFVFSVLIILCTIMVLYAAFIYVTANGDSEKLIQARQILVYAAVGIAVALLAGGFPDIIRNIIEGDSGPNIVDNISWRYSI